MLKTLAAAALIAVAGPAAAATFDAFASFDGVNNPAGPFTFGQTDGVTLTPFTDFSMCIPGITCLRSTTEPALGVYQNSGAAFSFDTIDIPAMTLFVHPGPQSAVFVQFTFPTSGIFQLDFTARLISNSTITGTNVSLFTPLGGSLFTVPIASLTAVSPSTAYTFTGAALAGDSFGFLVDNAGDYTFDSTAITFTLTEVPEPATWSLMITGFGLVGLGLRRRTALAA